jgi:hypothetical protein
MDGGKKTKDAFAGNVYKRIVDEHDLRNKVPYAQLWYGEVFGYGIQKNYSYGLKEGQVDVAFMDIKDVMLNEYFDFHAMVEQVEAVGEQVVPYTTGKFDKADILATLNDIGLVSFVDNKTHPIEGFVIRRDHSEKFYGGRLILKLLSDKYLLLKDNTDWH